MYRAGVLVVVLCAGSSVACHRPSRSRVEAVAESDHPFVLPGIERGVCLARIHARTTLRPASTHAVERKSAVVVAEGTSIVVDGRRLALEPSREVEEPILASLGWSLDYRYELDLDDPAREPPPDVLWHMVERSTDASLRDDLLVARCDGNRDCIRRERTGAEREIARVSWSVHAIPCGETFEWAGEPPP